MREIGYDHETGLTYSRIPVNSRTGMPELEKADRESSARNEAIHIAILAKAISGDAFATQIYSREEALSILEKKLANLKDFSGNNIQWALYGTLSALEDNLPGQETLLNKISTIINDFDFGSDALSYTSELDLLLKPLLSNPEFRAKFRSH